MEVAPMEVVLAETVAIKIEITRDKIARVI